MRKYFLILLMLGSFTSLKAMDIEESGKTKQQISLNYSISYQGEGERINGIWNTLDTAYDKKEYLANDVTHMFLSLGFFLSLIDVKEEKAYLILNDVTGGRLKKSVFVDIIYSLYSTRLKLELENSWEDIYKIVENEESPKDEANFMFLNVFNKMKNRMKKRGIENCFSRIAVVSNKDKEYSFYSISNTDEEKDRSDNVLKELKEVLPLRYYAEFDKYKKAYNLK